jgi:hypothetical protein
MSTTISARRISSSAGAALVAALLAGGARADVLHVPGASPPCRRAGRGAAGDEVVLAPGSYDETILSAGPERHHAARPGQGRPHGGTALVPAIEVLDSNDIVVDHLRIEGALGVGVVAADGTGLTLSRLRVTGSASTASRPARPSVSSSTTASCRARAGTASISRSPTSPA